MKKALIFFFACYLVFNACGEPKSTESVTTTYPPIDTIKIAAIDTLSEQINKYWRPDENFHILPLNERDTIQYIELNGEPQRISSIFVTDSSLIWTLFYQVNNELKLVRYRENLKNPQPSVKEAISYLENGKIFYAMERSKVLEPGDPIAIFRLLPFLKNVRPPAEMEAEYAPYWEITKKAVEQDRAARK